MGLAAPMAAADGGDRYFVQHDEQGWGVAIRDADGRIYDALPGVRTPGRSQAVALATGLFNAYTDGMWDGLQKSYRELRTENDELQRQLKWRSIG